MMKMAKYFIWCFFAQVIPILLSPIAVLIGLGFSRPDYSRMESFKKYKFPENIWVYYDLPDWLGWYQNPEDGLMGDKRGWYWNECCAQWLPGWVRMWWWSGFRNPANRLKRFILGLDIRDYVIIKVRGQDYVRDDLQSTGFQILKAKPKRFGNKAHWMLYWVWKWPNTNRAIVVQLGAKIKLSHNHVNYVDEPDYFKGITFEVNPFKDIS